MNYKLLLIIGLALLVASIGYAQLPVTTPQQVAPPSNTTPALKAPRIKLINMTPDPAKSGGIKLDGKPVHFAVETFGQAATSDLNNADYAAGVGAVVNLGDYWAIGSEVTGFDTRGQLVDQVSAIARYNILTATKSRPYILGGYWWDLRDESSGIDLGVGVQHQFATWFTPFGDIRMHKPLQGAEDQGPSAIVRAGLSFGF